IYDFYLSRTISDVFKSVIQVIDISIQRVIIELLSLLSLFFPVSFLIFFLIFFHIFFMIFFLIFSQIFFPSFFDRFWFIYNVQRSFFFIFQICTGNNIVCYLQLYDVRFIELSITLLKIVMQQ